MQQVGVCQNNVGVRANVSTCACVRVRIEAGRANSIPEPPAANKRLQRAVLVLGERTRREDVQRSGAVWAGEESLHGGQVVDKALA